MLGIIVNSKSGNYTRKLDCIVSELRQRQMPYVVRLTEYAAHSTVIARQMAEDGVDEIVVVGGDGTLSEAVNGIMTADTGSKDRQSIVIGLIPSGTGNDFGRYWRLYPRNWKTAVGRFLDGSIYDIDAGCIRYKEAGETKTRYFLNSVGFGLDALCCVNADRFRRYWGSHNINYVIGLLLALRQKKRRPVAISADGKRLWQDELFTMNIGNGPFSGGGIRQNPQADPSDGLFHAVCARRPSAKEIWRALMNLKNDKLVTMPFFRSFLGSEIEIQTSETLVFETDGIVGVAEDSCSVSCLRHALRIRC